MTDREKPLGPRTHWKLARAETWEVLWEAASYYDRLSELMEEARSFVAIVGWQIDSRLPLRRPIPGVPLHRTPFEPLREKLIRLCDSTPALEIFLLVWDHACLYVPEREPFAGRVWDSIHPRVHFVFDNRHAIGAGHHEKVCLVDGRVALAGGIDLCDERWDSAAHRHRDRRRSLSRQAEHHGPYHDLSVQVSGEICEELQLHVARRWRRVSSRPFPAFRPPARPRQAGAEHAVYLSRTRAGGRGLIREIEHLHRELVRRARRRIILEGQYYWSERFNDLLIAKIHEMRGSDFELTLILAELGATRSATRFMAEYELGLLDRLASAARYSGVRLRIGTPYSYPDAAGKARPVYVHSKVIVVDDEFLSIGSANLAERAMRLDSELALTWQARTESDRERVRAFSERLLHHWDRPRVALRRPGLVPSATTRLPWRKLFDPELTRLGPSVAGFAASCGPLALGLTAEVLLAANLGLPARALPWAAAYAIALGASAALPIPFLPVALAATLQLARYPGAPGLRLAIGSLWITSLAGYLSARAAPLATARAAKRCSASFGSREFPRVLGAMLDPLASWRRKLACEGISCVPLPWFALINGLLLPSVLYGLLRLSLEAWVAIAPRLVFQLPG